MTHVKEYFKLFCSIHKLPLFYKSWKLTLQHGLGSSGYWREGFGLKSILIKSFLSFLTDCSTGWLLDLLRDVGSPLPACGLQSEPYGKETESPREMRKGARRPEWTPRLLYVIIWRGLQTPCFVFDGWACLGRTAALCGWGGFPVGWVSPSCSQGHLWNVHTAAPSIIIFLAIYGSVMFCFLLSLSLFPHTHTHSL